MNEICVCVRVSPYIWAHREYESAEKRKDRSGDGTILSLGAETSTSRLTRTPASNRVPPSLLNSSSLGTSPLSLSPSRHDVSLVFNNHIVTIFCYIHFFLLLFLSLFTATWKRIYNSPWAREHVANRVEVNALCLVISNDVQTKRRQHQNQ